ncbi:MAG: hypothetical protein WBI82_02630 [Sphaerochaeta sp.]
MNGKKVNKRLGHDEAILIEQWIKNRKEIEVILVEMKIVSDQALSLSAKCNKPLPQRINPIT